MRRPSRCVTVPKKPWRHLRSEQAQRDGEVCNTSLKRSRRLVMVMILGIISRTIGSDHLIKDVRINFRSHLVCAARAFARNWASVFQLRRCSDGNASLVNGAMDAV